MNVDHGFVGEGGQVDPEGAQGREPLRERGGQVVVEHLHVHLEAQYLGAVEPARDVIQALGEEREGVVVPAREREHEAHLHRVLEAERVLRRPGVRRKAQQAELQIAQGAAEGGGVLGAAGRLQAHFGEGKALLRVRHQPAGAVQVADDVEEVLAVGKIQLAREQPADFEVEGGPFCRRDHGVGALLDLVVGEVVAVAAGDHESLADSGIEAAVHLVRRALANRGKHVELEPVADGRGELQRFHRLGRQARDGAHHEVDDIVRVRERIDPGKIPAPA